MSTKRYGTKGFKIGMPYLKKKNKSTRFNNFSRYKRNALPGHPASF